MKQKQIIYAVGVLAIVLVCAYIGTRHLPSRTHATVPEPKLTLESICTNIAVTKTFTTEDDKQTYIQDCMQNKHPEAIDAYVKMLNTQNAPKK
jgi:hypothetical protein